MLIERVKHIESNTKDIEDLKALIADLLLKINKLEERLLVIENL